GGSPKPALGHRKTEPTYPCSQLWGAGLFRATCLVSCCLLNIARAARWKFHAAAQRESTRRATNRVFSNLGTGPLTRRPRNGRGRGFPWRFAVGVSTQIGQVGTKVQSPPMSVRFYRVAWLLPLLVIASCETTSSG